MPKKLYKVLIVVSELTPPPHRTHRDPLFGRIWPNYRLEI